MSLSMQATPMLNTKVQTNYTKQAESSSIECVGQSKKMCHLLHCATAQQSRWPSRSHVIRGCTTPLVIRCSHGHHLHGEGNSDMDISTPINCVHASAYETRRSLRQSTSKKIVFHPEESKACMHDHDKNKATQGRPVHCSC